MSDNDFQQRYEAIMAKYHDYFEHVRTAFKSHCEEIKQKTMQRLKEVPEGDEEVKQQILMEQKEELDQTLSELKQLLNYQSAQMRKTLEDIRREQEAQNFSLEEELANL